MFVNWSTRHRVTATRSHSAKKNKTKKASDRSAQKCHFFVLVHDAKKLEEETNGTTFVLFFPIGNIFFFIGKFN